MLQNIIAYGCLGLLIEVVFTGTKSALQGDITAKSHSSLWMLPVYGIGGFLLEVTRFRLVAWVYAHDTSPAMYITLGLVVSVIYMIEIYVLELISGVVYLRMFGRKLWDYGSSKWTPLGLVNLKYGLYWYALAAAFHFFSPWFISSINKISRL